jgi:predicted AlkP superfamily phosphohydrolase/phosphomutase
MPDRFASKVILLGLHAAEWELISRLADTDLLPGFQRLMQDGVVGRMETLQPPLSAPAWTSVLTGHRPEIHGVLGVNEPSEDRQEVRPIGGAYRRVKSVWNILSEHGLQSLVVGWPGTRPAESITGVMVADDFDQPAGDSVSHWPLGERHVSPTATHDTVGDLRMHPGELTQADLQHFIPGLNETLSTDPDVLLLAQATAETVSRQAVATHLVENHPWDFLAVYFPFLDRISRLFMDYHPPRLPHVDENRFELFRHVITRGYQFFDGMVSRLLDLAGPEAAVSWFVRCRGSTQEARAPLPGLGSLRPWPAGTDPAGSVS